MLEDSAQSTQSIEVFDGHYPRLVWWTQESCANIQRSGNNELQQRKRQLYSAPDSENQIILIKVIS